MQTFTTHSPSPITFRPPPEQQPLPYLSCPRKIFCCAFTMFGLMSCTAIVIRSRLSKSGRFGVNIYACAILDPFDAQQYQFGNRHKWRNYHWRNRDHVQLCIHIRVIYIILVRFFPLLGLAPHDCFPGLVRFLPRHLVPAQLDPHHHSLQQPQPQLPRHRTALPLPPQAVSMARMVPWGLTSTVVKLVP